MKLFKKRRSLQDLLIPPVMANHKEYSMILSSVDETPPSSDLIQTSIKAIKKASEMTLDSLKDRIGEHQHLYLWPGEHYRLLASLIKVIKAKTVVEIGTATGLSALSMLEALPKNGQLISFDILPWQEIEGSYLNEGDFSSGRLLQYADDLSNRMVMEKHRPVLEKADLIFIDATHDGRLESQLMENFRHLHFEKPPLFFFDDIRVWTMLRFWREITMPKIDLTSFGHWSGSGLVEWNS